MPQHLGVRASDFDASKRFYTAALAPPRVVAFYEADGVAEFGRADGDGPSRSLHAGEPTRRLQLAFGAPDRETVDVFSAAAIAAGRDNGRPRPEYRASCAIVRL